MHADNSTEKRVIALLRARDPEGLTAAYDLYAPTAFGLLVRITRDRAVAEDLLQELFLRLWNHALDFDASRGRLGIWLMSIARHIAIDHVRSAQTRFSTRLRPIDSPDAPCFARDPNSQETRITDQETIRKAFVALSAEEQHIVELAYFEGFSQTEIAERLHEPLGTIKSRIRSALQRLRAAIKGAGEL
jgi:RNA polymerase sigma-70 factor, ECF subfamily